MDERRTTQGARELHMLMGLTFLVVGMMALVALWMYWIAPTLLR